MPRVSRTDEFGSGLNHAKMDVQPGVQIDFWANKRYAGRNQLPAASERRAGPLPYPETKMDSARDDAEYRASRGQ